jgi:hypothetical protein
MLVRVFRGNSDNEEIKYFLEFVNAGAECNVVTLGMRMLIKNVCLNRYKEIARNIFKKSEKNNYYCLNGDFFR